MSRIRHALAVGLGLLVLTSGVAAALLNEPMGGHLDGDRLARAARSPRFQDGAFVNALPTNLMAPGRTVESLSRFVTAPGPRTPAAPMPVVHPTPDELAAPAASGLDARWMGHATTLLTLGRWHILTDPQLSHRASPVTFAGPSRYHDLPAPVDILPPIDVAVVSHDHYDHLDMATVKALAAWGVRFVVPLGIGAHLDAWGVAPDQIVELDWWERFDAGGLTVTCVPARHYSGRGLTTNPTLWAGWVFDDGARRAYYSGDTGWSDHFQEIGARLGPFDLTLIKIGEYDETWPEIHIDPEEAVRAHQAVGGRVMLPVHWGTFNLAYHPWDEPIRRAVAAATAAGVTIVTPRPGERIDALAPPPPSPWWEAVQ